MKNPPYLTVKALTKYIKRKFDVDPHLTNVYVKGEISNFKRHTSGHFYFTLKDQDSRILAVMFSSAVRTIKFIPENGMNVLIRGSVTVYDASGQYQIYVEEMQPDGIGELFLAYEHLKEKLGKEGLFEQERKKPIPSFPKKIGVITSPTGAAIRDIITTIDRRYPIGKIIIIPVFVQGQKAANSVAKAIKKANDLRIADVLIVGRGGGSIEELWAFNEEVVARAISQSHIPIISAVGHETDFTIADLVADIRAATPTGAAELAVPHVDDVMERLLNHKNRLFRSMINMTKAKREKLASMERSYIIRNPHKLYEQKWEQMDRILDRLEQGSERNFNRKKERLQILERSLTKHHPAMKLEMNKEKLYRLHQQLHQNNQIILNSKTNQFNQLVSTLDALSPLNILRRGYSVAYDPDGFLVKSIEERSPGDEIVLQVKDGRYYCLINHIEKGESNG